MEFTDTKRYRVQGHPNTYIVLKDNEPVYTGSAMDVRKFLHIGNHKFHNCLRFNIPIGEYEVIEDFYEVPCQSVCIHREKGWNYYVRDDGSFYKEQGAETQEVNVSWSQSKGYWTGLVRLGTKVYRANRLVAKAFLKGEGVVCVKDGNPKNIDVSNLYFEPCLNTRTSRGIKVVRAKETKRFKDAYEASDYFHYSTVAIRKFARLHKVVDGWTFTYEERR